MKNVPLQLITVELEDGDRGVFVGWPLVDEDPDQDETQVEDIWFSNIQNVPEDLTVAQLMEMVRRQTCRCRSGSMH